MRFSRVVYGAAPAVEFQEHQVVTQAAHDEGLQLGEMGQMIAQTAPAVEFQEHQVVTKAVHDSGLHLGELGQMIARTMDIVCLSQHVRDYWAPGAEFASTIPKVVPVLHALDHGPEGPEYQRLQQIVPQFVKHVVHLCYGTETEGGANWELLNSDVGSIHLFIMILSALAVVEVPSEAIAPSVVLKPASSVLRKAVKKRLEQMQVPTEVPTEVPALTKLANEVCCKLANDFQMLEIRVKDATSDTTV